MKKIIINIFLFLFRNNPYFLNRIFYLNLLRLKNNRPLLQNFIAQSGNTFYNELEKYPSLFNDGYKHIDKAIELTEYFKLPSSNAIIDVGAASGLVSVRFAKAFPSATVYSFEPIPNTFELLKKETAEFPSIQIHNKALGNEVKTIDIHLAARVTASSLFDIKKNLTNEFWAKNLKEEGTVSVSMSKLDLEIPQDQNVSILKMDVQGYELEVLKGGTETLKRTALVLVELQNHDLYVGAPKYYEIDEFLRSSNFELYNMIPSIRQDEKLYEWDAIYVNKNRK